MLRLTLRRPEALPPRWLACVLRGHRWDPAPRRDLQLMRCVRCGMTAEPVTAAR